MSLEYLRVSRVIQYLPYYTPLHLTECKAEGKWKTSVDLLDREILKAMIN